MCSTNVQVSQVLIEDVNADYGAPSDMPGSGETRPKLPRTKSLPATCMREIFGQDR